MCDVGCARMEGEGRVLSERVTVGARRVECAQCGAGGMQAVHQRENA